MARINLDINLALAEEIGQGYPGAEILHDVLFGRTIAGLGAVDVLCVGETSSSEMYDLCRVIITLACEFPFLQPRLVALISSVAQLRRRGYDTLEPKFLKPMATIIGDLSQSNYARMFDEGTNTSEITEYVNLHGFLASIIAEMGVMLPNEQITGIADALFIISTSLEDHRESHHKPHVDVPAAAQYMIQAAALIYQSCQQGYVSELP